MTDKSFDECRKVTSYHSESLPIVAMKELAELISAVSEYEMKGYGS